MKDGRLDIPGISKFLYPSGEPKSRAVQQKTEFDYRCKLFMKHAKGKYGHLMHIETHPNGGAKVLHSYQDELDALSPGELQEFAREYFDLCFSEENERAKFVMGIVHSSANYLPDLIEYFAIYHPNLLVKTQMLGKPEIEASYMEKFRENVHSTYKEGTFRSGSLSQVRSRIGVMDCFRPFSARTYYTCISTCT